MIYYFNTSRPPVHVCEVMTGLTMTTEVTTSKAVLYGLLMQTDGVNDVTVNLYNGAGLTLSRVAPTDMVVRGASLTYSLSFAPGLQCDNGITVSAAVAVGGTISFAVYYED